MCVVPAVALVLASRATGQPAPEFAGKIKQPIRILDDLNYASIISPDGHAVTVLFDDFMLESRPLRAAPLVATRAQTLRIPVAENSQDLDLTIDIRGFVSTHERAHATLILHACGESTVVDIAEAIKAAKGTPATKEELSQRSAPASMGVADDFYVRLNRKLRANASPYVTFFLLVEKDVDDEEVSAVLVIDSVDAELHIAGK